MYNLTQEKEQKTKYFDRYSRQIGPPENENCFFFTKKQAYAKY